MTSRTNHHVEGPGDSLKTPTSSSAHEQRCQEAVERYLAGDPMEVICQEMGCAKSWLYTWKNRYEASKPNWFQEHSRRPETTVTKTPASLEAHIAQLRQTLLPGGSGTVSARGIRDHLRQHGVTSIPSRRTIYRMLKRQAKEVNADALTS